MTILISLTVSLSSTYFSDMFYSSRLICDPKSEWNFRRSRKMRLYLFCTQKYCASLSFPRSEMIECFFSRERPLTLTVTKEEIRKLVVVRNPDLHTKQMTISLRQCRRTTETIFSNCPTIAGRYKCRWFGNSICIHNYRDRPQSRRLQTVKVQPLQALFLQTSVAV